jgi:hypothetical protein
MMEEKSAPNPDADFRTHYPGFQRSIRIYLIIFKGLVAEVRDICFRGMKRRKPGSGEGEMEIRPKLS